MTGSWTFTFWKVDQVDHSALNTTENSWATMKRRISEIAADTLHRLDVIVGRVGHSATPEVISTPTQSISVGKGEGGRRYRLFTPPTDSTCDRFLGGTIRGGQVASRPHEVLAMSNVSREELYITAYHGPHQASYGWGRVQRDRRVRLHARPPPRGTRT
jgi:hypothetical protein